MVILLMSSVFFILFGLFSDSFRPFLPKLWELDLAIKLGEVNSY